MTSAARSRFGPTLLVAVAGASFAMSSPLARYARPAAPLIIAFGRLALAAVVLLLFDARSLGRSVRALSTRQRWLVLGAGVLLGAHFGCFQWGLDHTSLPAAASLVALEPVSVVLIAWALFGIRPRPVEYAALAIATVGAVVVGSAAGSGDHRLAGDLVVVLAVVLYGFYIALARALRGAVPTRSYVALVYAGASITLALALPWSSGPGALELPLHSVVAIGLLALVPTLIGHTAVQAAARTLAPAIVALVSPCETLGAIAVAAVWFGDTPTAREFAGAALILGGTTLALLSARAEVEPSGA